MLLTLLLSLIVIVSIFLILLIVVGLIQDFWLPWAYVSRPAEGLPGPFKGISAFFKAGNRHRRTLSRRRVNPPPALVPTSNVFYMAAAALRAFRGIRNFPMASSGTPCRAKWFRHAFRRA